MFFCDFCKISKNTFSYRPPPVATSVNGYIYETIYQNMITWSIKSSVKLLPMLFASCLKRKCLLSKYMPRNKSRKYLHPLPPPPPLLSVSFRAGFSLRKHLVRAKVYPLLRNADHLVVTKVDVSLVLMLIIQTLFRILLQRRVTK